MPVWQTYSAKITINDLAPSPSTISRCAHLRMMNSSERMGLIHQGTAAGWAWALVLSEVAPERRDQLVARGIDYGKSRSICNVHWLSDVQASQIIGSAAVAQLHTDPVFRADLRAAALEVKALREQGRKPDAAYCSLEIKALRQ